MPNYKKYYSIIKKKQQCFECIIDKIKHSNKLETKLFYADIALKYAVKQPTGYYTSAFLENFYTEYAKTLKFDNYHKEYKENSFLHVLTSGYSSGGHTRVVERWIKNAPDNQIHSVVITEPCDDIPVLEENIKEKNGEYILFEKNLDLETRALKLRALALDYQYIILHTHMDDPTAVVAFGVEEFSRPVIFYNHASHLFWVGKSIADLVLDLIDGDRVTHEKRGIENTFFVGIPTFATDKKIISKKDARTKIGIPLDRKIIMSSASNIKYFPIGTDCFYNNIKDILKNDIYCYVIGPSMDEKLWQKYNKESDGHIIPLGIIDFNKGYLDYIASADLYIDSYPLCSWTAMMDSISQNIPSLSLKCAIDMLDYFKHTNGYCLTKDELTKKTLKVLQDENYAKELIREEKESLFRTQSVESWNSKIQNMLKTVPQKHTVKHLCEENDYREIDDLDVLNHFCNNNKVKINCFSKLVFTLKYCMYKLLNKKQKECKYYILVNSL